MYTIYTTLFSQGEMMKKLSVLVSVFLFSGLLPAAEGWDLVSSYYKSVGVTSYSSPAIVDIDNDGDNDMFLGDYNGNLAYFRNDGTAASPTFNTVDTVFDSIDVGSQCSPAFCDIDNDGDQDLFLGSYAGTIAFYRNDGSATVPAFTLVDANYYSIDVGSISRPAFGDLDGDGDLDMLVGNSGGTLTHYRNEGTAQAAYWVMATSLYDSIDVGSYSAPILVDIDADGDLDLFIGNYSGTIAFYRNDGTSLSPAWNLIDATYFMIDIGSYSVPAFADIDGDNDLDMYIGESAGNLNFHRNEGTPQAQYFATISDIYSAISAGSYSIPLLVDTDRDGDKDLVIGQGDGTLRYFKNVGTSTVPAWQEDATVFQGIDVGDRAVPALTDMDNDNDLDLLVGHANGTIYYYRNDGSSSSPSYTLVDANYHSISVSSYSAPAFTDIDGDGDQDLFIGNYNGYIAFYRNEGTPSAPYWALVTSNYGSMDVGYNSMPVFIDIDDDGDQDLYVGNSTGTIYFYYNGGTALSPDLALVSTYYASIDIGSYSSVTFGDLDGDSDPDMLMGKSDGYLAFYRNNGVQHQLYWAEVSSAYLGIDVGSYSVPAFADIDADGDLDLFIGNSSGYLSFYRNDGSAGAPACTLISNYYDSIKVASYCAPVFGDLDNDGDQDLLVGDYNGNLSYYRNDGTALSPAWTLVDAMYFNIDAGYNSIPALADIDADGDLDLFIGNSYGTLYFYRNEGSAAGPYWKQESTSFGSIDVGDNSAPAFFDIDGDGDLDLFVGEEYGDISFYRNDSTPQVPSYTLETSTYNSIDVGDHITLTFADLDGDGNIGLFAGDYYGYLHYWEALSPIVGIEEPSVALQPSVAPVIGCAPSPVTDQVTVSFGTPHMGAAFLRVFDAAGREVARRENISGGTVRLDARNWQPGLYILEYQYGAVRATRPLTVVR